MSPVKEAAIHVIQSLPEDCSHLDILRHLVLREKLVHAHADVEAGRVHSDEEVEERMEQWLESFGPKQA